MEKPKILVIAGPTAVGKTKYAIEMAREFHGEIVSCDSMQIYQYMDIGSAKPSPQELKQAVHHLVDFVDPREDFSVAKYQRYARDCIMDIISRGKLPVISGGTGLYLNSILYDMDFANASGDKEYRALLQNIAEEKGADELHRLLREKDPSAAESIHPNNIKKTIRALERLHLDGEYKSFQQVTKKAEEYDPVMVCLNRERTELYQRINYRVDLLVEQGLVEEVKGLLESGLTYENISMKGIGYKEIIEHLNGECTLDEAIEKTKKNTRRYAKRQLTWFRRYDTMCWLNISDFKDDDEAMEVLKKCLAQKL